MGMTSVRMPDELMERLEQAAARLRRSKSWVIKDAVEDYLLREERKSQRDKETLEALKDYKAGRIIEENSMTEWLESWGEEDEKVPPIK